MRKANIGNKQVLPMILFKTDLELEILCQNRRNII